MKLPGYFPQCYAHVCGESDIHPSSVVALITQAADC